MKVTYCGNVPKNDLQVNGDLLKRQVHCNFPLLTETAPLVIDQELIHEHKGVLMKQWMGELALILFS